jgi:hypothetical protein
MMAGYAGRVLIPTVIMCERMKDVHEERESHFAIPVTPANDACEHIPLFTSLKPPVSHVKQHNHNLSFCKLLFPCHAISYPILSHKPA